MSIPRICKEQRVQCQDVVMHVLYSGSATDLLRLLISQCVQNIGHDFPTNGVRCALAHFRPTADWGVGLLRAAFFVLLNQDSRMRRALCAPMVPHLPPLCPYKACRFYDQLRDEILIEWIKDEHVQTIQLVERTKESYLVA